MEEGGRKGKEEKRQVETENTKRKSKSMQKTEGQVKEMLKKDREGVN